MKEEDATELALEEGGRAKSEEEVGNDGLEDALGIACQCFDCNPRPERKIKCGKEMLRFKINSALSFGIQKKYNKY